MGNKKRTKSKAKKEPVRIREKVLKDGNISLYFDIYRNGKRIYDFPKLYIVPEKTDDDKEKNRQTWVRVNKMKLEKIVELENNETGFLMNSLKQKAYFVEYVKKIAEQKQEAYIKGRVNKSKKQESPSRGVYHTYMGLARHLTVYRGDKVTFKQINKEYCIGFNEYLKTAENGTYKQDGDAYSTSFLSESSQCGYSRLLSIVLNCAVREEIIPNNPMKMLTRYERPKQPESSREYLTAEEVMQLLATPCMKPMVKQAFLFTCFSGLRFSDVRNLNWGDIHIDSEGKKVIRYTQQKTQKPEYLQVSDNAMQFLPDRNGAKDGDVIFKLASNGYINQILKNWTFAAGLKKRVTWHVGRHTNATLLLSLGVPIETVSKMLGHTDIRTTQIYTKVIDKSKRDAADKLGSLLSGITVNN